MLSFPFNWAYLKKKQDCSDPDPILFLAQTSNILWPCILPLPITNCNWLQKFLSEFSRSGLRILLWAHYTFNGQYMYMNIGPQTIYLLVLFLCPINLRGRPLMIMGERKKLISTVRIASMLFFQGRPLRYPQMWGLRFAWRRQMINGPSLSPFLSMAIYHCTKWFRNFKTEMNLTKWIASQELVVSQLGLACGSLHHSIIVLHNNCLLNIIRKVLAKFIPEFQLTKQITSSFSNRHSFHFLFSGSINILKSKLMLSIMVM